MLNKSDRQNCFLDLQRAATSFYLNPKGKTWQIFFDHAFKVLKGEKKFEKMLGEMRKVKKEAVRAQKEEVIKLADKMLTLGILIRG